MKPRIPRPFSGIAVSRLGLTAAALALAAGRVGAGTLPDEQALVLQYTPSSFGASGGISSLAAGDLDGDGDLDLLCADETNDRLRILLNDRGQFPQMSLDVGVGPSAVGLADLDLDGDLDVVVGLHSQLRVLLNAGAGHLDPQPPLSFPLNDITPVGLAIADVSGDGRLDVLVGLSHHSLPSGSWTGGLVVGLGDGQGGLQLQPTHPLAWPARRLAAADFDGDGHLDVAEMGSAGASVNVAFGDGQGGFTNGAASYAAGAYASGFTAGDWDGDGDIDLATGSKYNLGLLLNDGAGQFSSGGSMSLGYYIKGLAAGDLDRDGDVDLLATFGSGSTLRLLRNDGTATFTVMASLPATVQTSAVLLADTSGDGYLDPWAGDVVEGSLVHGISRCLVARYGAGKPNSLDCLPAMTALGSPSIAGGGFTVQATNLLPGQPALVLAGVAPASLPGLGGTLLVQPPWLQLATLTGPGLPGACDGVVSLPLTAGALAGLGVGARVHVQVLIKDPFLPAPPLVSMSDGLWFEIVP